MSAADIPALEVEVGRLANLLAEAKAILRQARIDAATYQVGTVVEVDFNGGYTREAKWQEAIVREIEVGYTSLTYKVSPRKKDGEWSLALRAVYSDGRIRPRADA